MPTPAATSVAGPLHAYLASLVAMGRGRLARLLALVVLGSLVEGLGILLLIPLSSAMFDWATPDSRIARIVQPLIDSFGRGQGLALMLAGFVGLMAVRAFILLRRDLGLFSLSAELVDRWRGRLMSALVHAEWNQLRDLNRGNLEFAVTGDVSRLSTGSDNLLLGAVASVQLLVLIALAVQLSPLFALATGVLMLLALPAATRIARAAYAHGQTLTRQGGKRQGAFAEFMAGMKLAKAHHAEDRYADEFMAISDEIRVSGLNYGMMRLRANAAVQLVAALLAALLLWVGVMVLHIAPAVLGALLVLFARMPGPALLLAQGVQSLAMLLPAIGNLERLEASLSAEPASLPASLPKHKAPAISLRGIGLRHDPARPLIEAMDFDLTSGSLTVLLGPSGSGKTTIADLLIGLTAPDSGTVSVDGHPIGSAAERSAWRQQIGYVPQDPFLFDLSLAENLRWAAPDASDEEIWSALAAADAADFVRALPEGLLARAGDRGGHFSGGERQRLCLARALLRRPALLVLDEATSALDPASEARLLLALQQLKGSVTILMIAHRIPDDFRPDRVIRLEQGRIA